jgi:hypothetical protein|tara:strand:+ start:3212 stop:3598 length:387 start_codon:yes stop_codon:yes gene_type:complete
VKEVRLLRRYKGHLDRFAGTASDYNWKNPGEALAGAGHVVTSGFGLDPAIRGVLGAADGSTKNGVGNYEGVFGFGGKTGENIASVASVFKGHFGRAIGGVVNAPLDAASDGMDFLAGVRHGEAYHTAA